MSEPYLGEIKTFGFSWPPRGWAGCNGQLLPISQNSALFSLLGTQFGGDGRTTFAAPDLRGRAPLHWGTGPGLTTRPFAYRYGNETTTLVSNNLPTAQPITAVTAITGEVALMATDSPGNAATANGHGLAKMALDSQASNALEIYDNSPSFSQGNQIAGVTHDLSAITHVTGGLSGGTSYPFSNMQPYLVLNYCIAMTGIYPSRN